MKGKAWCNSESTHPNFNLCSLNLHMVFHLLFICPFIVSALANFFNVKLLEILDLDQKVGRNQNVLLGQIDALNFVISHELKIKERGKINRLFFIQRSYHIFGQKDFWQKNIVHGCLQCEHL